MIKTPKLIIHGGAGSLEGNVSKKEDLQIALNDICKSTYNICNVVVSFPQICKWYQKTLFCLV